MKLRAKFSLWMMGLITLIVAGIAERHDSGVPEAWSKATANIYRAMLAAL
jgi:hypothetical protein